MPSHWYSLSRDPNPDWSQSFSSQVCFRIIITTSRSYILSLSKPEIQQYMKDVATRNKLRPHIRFGHHLVSSEWDSKMHYYNVEYETTSTSGATVKSSIKAHAIISAMGGLHIPKMPDIPGINDFQGTMFHSAQWRHDVDLKGKTVGIIGNGCSSCQIVPAITEDSSVNVVNFCRTPAWFAPSTSDSNLHSCSLLMYHPQDRKSNFGVLLDGSSATFHLFISSTGYRSLLIPNSDSLRGSRR